jgi:cell division protein ZapE
MGASPHDLTDNRQLATGNQGMLRELDAQFQSRRIIPDAAQQAAAERLQRLYDELVAFKHQRRSKLRKLLVNPPLPRGTYLWGGVGRGKSLLMDCFFDTVPYQRKRRVHFHAFMREVHERLRALKNEEDPLLKVADRIARETRLMCFDEFHVSDIADAMILGRLMEALFERGVVFCLTSNYPPDGLYPNGLQRHNFLPTITLLKERLDVLEVDGGIDYRLRALEKVEVFHVPADAEGEAKMEAAFREISGGEGHRRPVNILERELPVERRAIGVIWFDFADAVHGAALAERLSGDRPPLPHRLPLRRAAHDARDGQRGAPLHLAGRCLLRPQGQARHDRRLRGCRSLSGRSAVRRVSAHRQPPGRDAHAGITSAPSTGPNRRGLPPVAFVARPVPGRLVQVQPDGLAGRGVLVAQAHHAGGDQQPDKDQNRQPDGFIVHQNHECRQRAAAGEEESRPVLHRRSPR